MGTAAPAFAFAYRDQVIRRSCCCRSVSQIHGHSRQEITLDAAEGQWHAQVEIEPLLGRPASLDVYLSAPLHKPWQVKADGEAGLVHHVERLPVQEALPHLLLLGAGSAREQAALHLSLPRGESWRIHFAQPLAQKTTLEFRGPFRPLPHRPAHAATAWDIPVLSLPAIQHQNGALIVRRRSTGDQACAPFQLENAAIPAGGSAVDDSAALHFRLTPTTGALAHLYLETKSGPAQASHALCESSELTTAVHHDGTLTHLLRVRLRSWRQPRFDVVIPGTVNALAAKIDGVWLDRLGVAQTGEDTRFALPANPGAAVQEVELLYVSAASRSGKLAADSCVDGARASSPPRAADAAALLATAIRVDPVGPRTLADTRRAGPAARGCPGRDCATGPSVACRRGAAAAVGLGEHRLDGSWRAVTLLKAEPHGARADARRCGWTGSSACPRGRALGGHRRGDGMRAAGKFPRHRPACGPGGQAHLGSELELVYVPHVPQRRRC